MQVNRKLNLRTNEKVLMRRNTLFDSVESPTSIPSPPSQSPFRFFNIKKKLPKTFRLNSSDRPILIGTNEVKPSATTNHAETAPDVG